MCAINFIWDKKHVLDDSTILKMNRVLEHRGPDFSSFSNIKLPQGQAFFGHNRLSILDLSEEGNQPFQDFDQNTLIFNGFISNYKSIVSKPCLCDGETLFKALNIGIDLHELNGMFTFVYYHHKTHSIKIVRDRHGIKPLYYFEDENFLIVSSEIKGVLASGLVDKVFNSAQLPYYFQHRFAKKPETFFKNIYELLEGEQIEIKNLSVTKSIWYQPQTSVTSNLSQTKLDQLILNSVSDHIQSDVPLGVFLSGGIDSTILATYAQEISNKKISTFSIHTELDKDLKYSRFVAQKLVTDHHEFLIEEDIFDHYQQFLMTIDQPIADPAFFLTWYLSQESRKYVKTILSGAGADEYFLGYNRHLAYQTFKNGWLDNNVLKKCFKKVLLFSNSRLSLKLSDKLDSTNYDQFSSLYQWTNFPNQDLLNAQTIQEAILLDKKYYLQSDILNMSDKASMNHGLEIRVPFLCNDLTEELNKLPDTFLLKLNQKWILKDLLKSKGFSKDFINRPKQGFEAPFGRWFKTNPSYYLEFLNDPYHPVYEYLDKKSIEKLLELHFSGKRDLSTELWSVKLFSDWLKINFS